MSETCGTCRHWTPPTADDVRFNYAPEHGRCERINHLEVAEPSDPAMAEDVEGYNAWLRTRPDFGCALWEAKP